MISGTSLSVIQKKLRLGKPNNRYYLLTLKGYSLMLFHHFYNSLTKCSQGVTDSNYIEDRTNYIGTNVGTCTLAYNAQQQGRML